MLNPRTIPSRENIESFYGKPGDESSLADVNLPYTMYLSWDTDYKINRFKAHKKIAESLESLFNDVLKHYGAENVKELRLDCFGGCYNYRNIRGGKELSTHSWGVAVDIDPEHNKLLWDSTQASLSHPVYNRFWEIVGMYGGQSLGRHSDRDWMHFQFVKF